MLIYVDDNELLHSATLVKALGDVALPMNLDSGDYLMYANGIKGNGVGGTAAVEHKRGVDLAGCVLFTNRHLDQLDKMGQLYDEVILLISQKIVPDEDGLAATPIKGQGLVPLTPAHSTQTISYKRYDKHLRTIERCMGVRVMETDGLKHAATRLLNLAEWWQTPLSDHSSHLGSYKPVNLMGNGVNGRKNTSLIRRVASEFDSIGLVRGRAVEELAKEKGANLREMVNWTEEDWKAVKGIDKTAGGIVKEVLDRDWWKKDV